MFKRSRCLELLDGVIHDLCLFGFLVQLDSLFYALSSRKEAAAPSSYYDVYNDRADPESKRSVGYDIMKNKGLIPYRSKDQRNPRVRQRSRFEKAQKAIKGFKPILVDKSKPYAGEATGIRTHIVKSRKL